jgi:hypothetical protein
MADEARAALIGAAKALSRAVTIQAGPVQLSLSDLFNVAEVDDALANLIAGFNEAIEACEKGTGNVVVVIDDLDRCLPESAIQILESLKLFLDGAQCIFVLAVDREALADAIRSRYPGAGDAIGRDYLDKIVQVPFNIPTPTVNNLWRMVAGTIGNINEQSRALVELGVKGNPRRLIRIANSVAVARRFQTVEGFSDQVPRTLLLWLTVLKITFPRFYEFAALTPVVLIEFANRVAAGSTDSRSLVGVGASAWIRWHEDSSLQDFIRDSNRIVGSENSPWKVTPSQMSNAFALVQLAAQ